MNSSLNFLKLAMISGMSSSAGKMVVLKWKTLQAKVDELARSLSVTLRKTCVPSSQKEPYVAKEKEVL
ncbi:hypothetical protein EUGRSUZ_H02510 [Eucalyptus grandis]|uniref:Uncharacterized protein n=2 Tax=Eucalyptus grandis TaxID=71139 RepID=A0ACC3JRY0_EUCGR|nr:hypothetical protein EUGRSUZ_H02510 [Eucalyptus grandis]